MTNHEEIARWQLTVSYHDGSWEDVFMTTDADETAEDIMSQDLNFDLPALDSVNGADDWHWITNDIEGTGYCFRPKDVRSVRLHKLKENNG